MAIGLSYTYAQDNNQEPEETPRPRTSRYSREEADDEPRRSSRSRRDREDTSPEDPLSEFRVRPRATPAPASRPTKPKSDGAKPARAKSASIKRQSSPRQASEQPITLPRMNTMYMDPLDQKVILGDQFETALILNNVNRDPIDRLKAVLRYDPNLVMPVGVVKGSIEDDLAHADAFDAKVFAEDGLVMVQAELKNSPTGGPKKWAHVRWQSVAPSAQSGIEFVTGVDESTGAYVSEENRLGDSATGIAGVIGAQYQIAVSEKDQKQSEELTEDLAESSYRSMYSSNAGAKVGFHLVAPTRPVRAGDSFFVDVFLDNPQSVQFDMLELRLAYDPSALMVVDYDDQNWIEKGTNIFDGAYHKKFPFDVHLENVAAEGQIRYRVGVNRGDQVFPSGRMASILFKALKPVRDAKVQFISPKNGEAGTSVKHLGTELADSSLLRGVEIQAVP